MKRTNITRLCVTGLLTALVLVFTAYLHVPSYTGYTHVGDAFIYLAACLLPTPHAVAVGVVGAVLADCFTGYAVWAPATAIIKAATALFFTAKAPRIFAPHNRWAMLPSAAVCTGGYYLYEVLITGSFAAPLAGIAGYITQVVLSCALFTAIAIPLDKLNFKSRFLNGGSSK